ncbi:hypothetical protein EW093_03080 [Thiospirochaeta perfilievii]|uniref:RHS repeat protein n=2 Tax=Thiospirochaeta perfilievii TaxID=252967 RepID=A0A5C1QAN6_9SPIO|nr:hypothetical protein EW093_03080 [Thiospirochaeta perfilievii]
MTREFNISYNELGQEVLRESDNDTSIMSYDAVGRMTSYLHKNRRQIVRAESFVYNELGQKILSVDETGAMSSYDYNALGQLAKAEYSYDSGYLKQSFAELKDLGYFKDKHDIWNYNSQLKINNGKRSNKNSLDRWDMSFEEQQLVRDASDLINPSWKYLDFNKNIWSEEFNYDVNGNINSKTTPFGTVDYSYNEENQLLVAGKKSFEFDYNGNMIKEIVNGNEIDMSYNFENRLSTYIEDVQKITYTYDVLEEETLDLLVIIARTI